MFRRLLKRVRGHIGDAKLVSRLGGKPFLMPKSNASSRAKGSYAWREMMLFREEHPGQFERRYHKTSNAESANSSLKGKYGEFLRSRKWHMQKREVGLRVIAYNLRRLVR